MKIQDLAIIFVIIIIPISLILSVFTQYQLKAINKQTQYDTMLTSATYDAIKAFQLNSGNNSTSDLANSKLRDLEASVATFKNSLKSSFGMDGYTEEELNSYIPALVYTLYDGLYIYSPYTNVNHRYETDKQGSTYLADGNGKELQGLKPYINYSCRYVKGNIDVVITYALDNFIKVQGNIGGEYINKSGYLIEGIEVSGDSVKYNGITIGKEHLKENIAGTLYSYAKVNGIKYYLLEDSEQIIYFLNGIPVVQYGKEHPQYIYFKNLIENNDSAQQYYKEAYEFTNWFKSTGLVNLQFSDAQNEMIKSDGTIEVGKVWENDTRFIFDEFNNSNNIENETSNFNQHRLAVIRHKIEVNLAIAIANYNSQLGGVDEFQIPELKEDEWDYIIHNISLISFLQGLPMGEKTYNGYTLVTNSESKEVVLEQNIYILGSDGAYHRIGDKQLETGSVTANDGEYGVYDSDSARSAGRLNLDFKRTSITDNNVVTKYYYPLQQYNASYDSIVMQNNVTTYDDIYEYVQKQKNLGNTDLAEAFYTALGRERYSGYRTSNIVEQQYRVLVAGKASSTTYGTYIRNITNELNLESEIKATYLFDTNTTTLTNYIMDQKENYNLIILHGFVWSLGLNSSTLQEISNTTNLITISNDAINLPIMKSGSTGTTTVVPQITDLGNEKLGNISITAPNDHQAYFKFKDDVEVFYTGTYSGAVTGEYDLIGSWKNGDHKWIHSQVSMNYNNKNHMNLLKALVKYSLGI